MSERRFAAALDESLRLLREGAGFDEAVERVGQAGSNEHDELASLLSTAAWLRAEPAPVRSTSARAATRNLLMASLTAARVEERRNVFMPPFLPPIPWRRLGFLPVAALAVAVIAIVMTTSQARETPSAVDQATVLTVLSGDVQVETPSGLLAATNGMLLRPGDRIVTGDGSKAVLTFFDGSTVTLDSQTVVAIEQSRDEAGTLRAVLTQSQGNTWTHVPQDLGPANIEIDTPNARVQSSDGSFATRVEDNGRTQVGSQSGGVNVTSGDSRTAVSAGQQASVESAGAVPSAGDAVRPARELLVRVSGPVYAFLTDPAGATVGTLAPGVPVNQVNGATARREGTDLVLRLPEPADGSYRIGLRGADAGAVSVAVTLQNGANESIKVEPGDNWTLDLRVTDGEVAFTSVERAVKDVTPVEVAVPDRAVEKARQVATATPEPTKAPATSTPTATSTSTATRVPPTATPTSTSTPRPTATSTPRPIATKTVSPVKEDAQEISSSDVAAPPVSSTRTEPSNRR